MPIRYFDCSEGRIATEDCLKKCPNLDGRCLSLPTLHKIAHVKPSTGTFTTTQLINPTRIEYLYTKHDYAIKPYDRAFDLLDTRHHQKLDEMTKALALVPDRHTENEETNDILNLLEPDDNRPSYYTLWGYKTWGSYAVAKALGVKQVHGEFTRNPEKADFSGVDLQLNAYRMKAESIDFPISKLLLQITVRDGGLKSAKYNGVPEKLCKVIIPRIDDDTVTEYFSNKRNDLKNALDNDELPTICSYEDRWGGRRCKYSCEVREFCPDSSKAKKPSVGGPYD